MCCYRILDQHPDRRAIEHLGSADHDCGAAHALALADQRHFSYTFIPLLGCASRMIAHWPFSAHDGVHPKPYIPQMLAPRSEQA
jgi:hypothetical protein